MLENGRWCGPAQVVLVESKTIVWITHMNRILRCARDNLRPVSLREFERHASFNQQIDTQRAQQMASQLRRRLHEKSGMFQFSDLSEIPPEHETTEAVVTHNQPEEEPTRRPSHEPVPEINPEEIAIPEKIAMSCTMPSSLKPTFPDLPSEVTKTHFGVKLKRTGDHTASMNSMFPSNRFKGFCKTQKFTPRFWQQPRGEPGLKSGMPL